jgi:hypothetical protein
MRCPVQLLLPNTIRLIKAVSFSSEQLSPKLILNENGTKEIIQEMIKKIVAGNANLQDYESRQKKQRMDEQK